MCVKPERRVEEIKDADRPLSWMYSQWYRHSSWSMSHNSPNIKRVHWASRWPPTVYGPPRHLWPGRTLPVRRSRRSNVRSAVRFPPAGRSAAWSELRPPGRGTAAKQWARWKSSATGWRIWTARCGRRLQGSWDMSINNYTPHQTQGDRRHSNSLIHHFNTVNIIIHPSNNDSANTDHCALTFTTRGRFDTSCLNTAVDRSFLPPTPRVSVRYPQVRLVSLITRTKHLKTLRYTTEVMSLTSAGGC